jgi:hypothetical protein
MAAVVDRGSATPAPEPPPEPTAHPGRSTQASKLLDMFAAAKPVNPDGFVPGLGMPAGADVPKPQGLYTYALIGPDVWPSESESQLGNIANQLEKLADDQQNASQTATAQSDNVFSTYWTAGDGAAAAGDHYRDERAHHENLIDAIRFVSGGYSRLSGHIGSIKRKMREAHDEAHREIEQTLRANKGQPVGVGPIVTTYRTLINEYSTELRGFVTDETAMLGNQFKLTPPPTEGGNGARREKPDDKSPSPSDDDNTSPSASDGTAVAGRRGQPGYEVLSGSTNPASGQSGAGTIAGRGQPPGVSASPAGSSRPQMPQVPSLPQVPGSGSSPLSGAASSGMGPLSGRMGSVNPGSGSASGLAASAGNAANPAGAQPASVRALSSALGGEFGRGLAAGASAASGAAPMPAPPVPQTPSAPLGVPPGSAATPAAAAPASAPAGPLAAVPGPSTGVPASAAGLGGSGAAAPMTPYGSVLPSTGAAAGTSPASLSPPPPSVTSGSGATPGAPPAGFVPAAVRDSGPVRVGRDISMTDLESARAAVADLAAASSAVDPGLQWAVVVARGASGMPEMWVTTNEGAGYIPRDVYVPRAMPLAAGLDPDFDARWFGWSNPADTALRAVQARGDAVSAIATTWPQESEEVRAATEDVAIGVAASGGPAEAGASTLTRGRSHRLETVDPALYHELSLAERPAVDAYVRQITQQVAFNAGPELSATAQSVARTLLSARWPSEAEWKALRAEYDSARLMAGSQHPGLMGIEESTQLLTYRSDFASCRRIETLLCWDNGSAADIAYAARAVGVIAAVTVA